MTDTDSNALDYLAGDLDDDASTPAHPARYATHPMEPDTVDLDDPSL